jgi:ABC-type sugar transport system permease subunit
MVNNILIQETPSSKVTIYTVVSTVINLIIGVLILLISAIVIKGKLQVGNYLIFIVPSFVVIGLVVIIFLILRSKDKEDSSGTLHIISKDVAEKALFIINERIKNSEKITPENLSKYIKKMKKNLAKLAQS